MKIETTVHERPPETITEFADRHGLVMVVNDYGNRFAAAFKNAEIRQGQSMLLSVSGKGTSESEAINDYADNISQRLLIVNAMSEKQRKEIWVPALKGGAI